MSKLLSSFVLSVCFFSIALAQTDHSDAQFVRQVLKDKNVVVDQIYITDHYTSMGITHTYFKQSIGGIPIYNSRGSIHYQNKNNVIVKQAFKRGLKSSTVSARPGLSAVRALESVAQEKGMDISGTMEVVEQTNDIIQKQKIRAPKISLRDIPGKLEYYIVGDSDLRLIWQLPVEDVNTAWYTNYLVDAHTGEIIEEVDWTVECNHGKAESHNHSCSKDHSRHFFNRKLTRSSSSVPNSYEVFAWPVESPNFGTRTTESSPWLDNAVASPNGWHTIGSDSYTTTRGNNTDTYIDNDNTNSPTGGDAARADGGATLDFSFPLDVDMDPTDYIEASITNTFYWTNLMHDLTMSAVKLKMAQVRAMQILEHRPMAPIRGCRCTYAQ